MGDPDAEVVGALEQLYRTRYARFYRLALAVLGNGEAAADAVQEAFVRALRGRARLESREALEPWVWRTVLNVSLTRRSARSERPDADPPASGVEDNGKLEDWSELRAAVASLPDRQREVLFLRHYADLDYERIGEVLGIARGTVAATLNQAHAALRARLEVPR